MANEEDKTVVQPNGKGEASAEESKGGKGFGSKKLLLFGGMGLGVIVLGVALAVFVVRPMISGSGEGDAKSEKTTRVEGSNSDSDRKHAAKQAEKPKKKEKHKKDSGHGEESGTIYTIKDIIINPAGTGGTRFLSVSFAFELESSDLKPGFEAREAVIRDALITILASKTVAQLTDPKQKEIVRYQIKKRVSDLMKTDELAGVYFTDFVLQ